MYVFPSLPQTEPTRRHAAAHTQRARPPRTTHRRPGLQEMPAHDSERNIIIIFSSIDHLLLNIGFPHKFPVRPIWPAPNGSHQPLLCRVFIVTIANRQSLTHVAGFWLRVVRKGQVVLGQARCQFVKTTPKSYKGALWLIVRNKNTNLGREHRPIDSTRHHNHSEMLHCWQLDNNVCRHTEFHTNEMFWRSVISSYVMWLDR